MTSTATKYTTPIFNLNGTSRENLSTSFTKARNQDTIEALRLSLATPETFSAHQWNQADFEKSEAIANVDSAMDWVDAWLMSAEEQDN